MPPRKRRSTTPTAPPPATYTGVAAARDGELWFRDVFETIADAIIVMDLDGIVRDWNPAAVRLYGYTREEIVGRPVTTIHRPELNGELEEEIQAGLRRDDRWSGELPFRRKDGTTGVADIVVVVQRGASGEPVSWIGVNRDATARIEAARELKRAHAMVAALLDASPVAIVAIDAEHRVTMWNPAAERLLGWSEREVRGRPLGEITGEDDAGHSVFRATVGAGRAVTGVEARCRRRDGTSVDVLLSAAPVRDDHGRLTGAVGLFSDMTDHRELEDQLRQSQKMDAVGQLAGGIAHDFNNLLTVIRTYGDFLADALSDGHPLHADVMEIQRAAGRASSLTRQLLAFSRKQHLQPQVLDIDEVVQGMGPMLQRLIGEDIRVMLSLAGDLPKVKADRGQLEQVVLNLVVNARDAMPRGGTLVLESSVLDLDDSYSALRTMVVPGPYVMLAVTDTGCGMDADTKARIFEPFFTTKEVGKGTGLGLSTVYGIVKQSGGYVWVYSEPRRGSTFKVYLPALVESTAPGVDGEMPAELLDGSEVILLVEDEEAVRTLARRILERHGYTVLEARDAADALRVASHFPTTIHAVVTDMVMPGQGGRELIDSLLASRPALRVLYMSGYTADDIVRRGLGAGIEPFLQKPFTASALARAIRGVLD